MQITATLKELVEKSNFVRLHLDGINLLIEKITHAGNEIVMQVEQHKFLCKADQLVSVDFVNASFITVTIPPGYNPYGCGTLRLRADFLVLKPITFEDLVGKEAGKKLTA